MKSATERGIPGRLLQIACLFFALPPRLCPAFSVSSFRGNSLLATSTTSHPLLSATRTDSEDTVILEKFESWFSSVNDSYLHSSIRHAFFGKLRGLTWTDSAGDGLPSTPVISVPLSIVLQSDIQQSTDNNADNDWDSNLANQLWYECQRPGSKLSGYCDFLKQGQDISDSEVPLSTAPKALRHWNEDELELLQETTAGKNLLRLQVEQQKMWKDKYDKLMATNDGGNRKMSWEQFQWAMEVVHSRAFRGNFGSNTSNEKNAVSSLLPTILPPLGAALAGTIYVQSTPYPNDIVLVGLGALALVPLIINLLQSSSAPPTAVLLPIIDSINHDEDADSSLEYDPLTECFQVSIGPKCLTPAPGQARPSSATTGSQTQLCISYGKRSDGELLLNYGFLPGVPCADDAPLSEQRARLAKAFNQRK